ncbi:MAG: amino acid permease [Planctomycetota bacterium]
MVGHSERPRELSWPHVAALLFGDWGTSRLYVLGLAFWMSGNASFWYVLAMCTLLCVVGFCYTIVCKHYPDGGGVYSAGKMRSPTLGVIGALLLVADYIITASLSAYEGFRYILPDGSPPAVAMYCAIGALVLIGLINTIGMRRVGAIALAVAILAAIFYFIIGIGCVVHWPHATIIRPHAAPLDQWKNFVNVILALSGVEAVANMTGVMREPVAKNARWTIFTVLIEIVVLNMIMTWAMNSIGSLQWAGSLYHTDAAGVAAKAVTRAHIQDGMVRIIAEHFVGKTFGWVAGFSFGLLLLSAANTAISGMISVQYMMSRDNELPRAFTKLNRFGMPWVALLVATVVPIVVLWGVGADTESLADLYAIGVVGAITLNLLVTGASTHLNLRVWEKATLIISGLIIWAIEFSIAWDKPKALIFALSVLAVGLIARKLAKVAQERRAQLAMAHAAGAEPALAAAPAPARKPTGIIPANLPRILVPTRGSPRLIKFAVGYAKAHNAALVLLYVNEIPLAFLERNAKLGTETMTLANDPQAQKMFADAKLLADAAGVPVLPMYAVHSSAADLIVDHAATLGVDAVIMGVSRRGTFWRTLRGDVIQEVVNHLPDSIPLLIHA